MKLEAVNLEYYQNLTLTELRDEILKVHKELREVKEELKNDHELQAAISLAESLKVPYTLRVKQKQKLLKTLDLLAEMKGL